MALSDILASITEETDKEIADLESAHKKKLSELSEQHKAELKDLKVAMRDDLKREAEDYVSKEQHMLSMKHKNALLMKKQELISSAVDAALEKMSSLDESAYIAFVTTLFADVDEAEFVIHPCKGRESETEAAMKAAGKSFTIGDSIDCKGGFKAVSDSVEIDNTFEALFASEREEIRLVASNQLFA